MEPPAEISGDSSGEYIRDEKVKLLKCIPPLAPKDVILGQFVAGNGKAGYLDDATCNNKYCPTYALTKFQINNPRWAGVPFVMISGKALDERKGEVRIVFKNPAGIDSQLHNPQFTPEKNELVIRIQPGEALTMKLNVKSPGFANDPIVSNMDLLYSDKFPKHQNGSRRVHKIDIRCVAQQQLCIVRNDELEAAWKIFTPLLHLLESPDRKEPPIKYKFGSTGPKEAEDFLGALHGRSNGEFASKL